MFVTMIDRNGSGTGVSFGWGTCEPAALKARMRRGGVAIGDLPTRRAGVLQLI